MEGTWSKSLHFKISNQGPHTLQNKTPTSTFNTTFVEKVQHKSVPRHDNCSEPAKRAEYFGNAYSSGFRFPVQNVSCQEAGWGNAPYIRPQGTKQIYNNQVFSVSDSDRCCRLLAAKRLDGENRSPPGLFSFAHSRTPPSFSKGILQQPGASINSTALWPVFCPPNFCHSIQLGCRDPTCSGHKTTSLFRRLYLSQPRQRQITESGLGDLKSSGKSRVACKLPKVGASALSRTRVSRSVVEYHRQYHDFTTKESVEDKGNCNKSFTERLLHSSGESMPTGLTKFCKPNNTERTPALSTNTKVSERIQRSQRIPKEGASSLCEARTTLVAERHRPQFKAYAQEGGDPLFDHRRCRCRLGRSFKRQVPHRHVDSSPEVLALQRKGIVCSLRRHCSKPKVPAECTCFSPVGQQNSGGLHQERGRDAIPSLAKADDQTTRPDSAPERHPFGGLPPGEVQRHCRPPVQESTSAGMALVAPGLGGRIQNLGQTRRRLVCNKTKRGRRLLRNMGLQRWVCNVLRRIQSTMEFRAGLGVPTTESHSTSSAPPQHGDRNVHHNSATLDSVLLASRSQGASSIRANNNTGATQQLDRFDNRQDPSSSAEVGTSSMENWGWANQVAHWSPKERDLLKKSWRSSTLSTYRAPIKRWITWCMQNSINPNCPQSNDVARFLAKLCIDDKLAYRTILLHKSAISTYTAAGEEISKNFFVQQILKATSLIKPPEKKTPIWDTEILFKWLRNTTRLDTLFDISRRTAIILLLASGRRIHDLTLLEMSKDSFIIDNDRHEITLWPKFGSKTDKADSRQSGWLLKQHPNENLCPVRHIINLIRTTKIRRSEGGNLTSLFISITGQIRPATRTIIAGWIRNVFKQAGIDASPGSVRSAVASRSFVENRPVEEIMERANWKSSNTFRNFYCRTVQRTASNNTDYLLNNFSVI